MPICGPSLWRSMRPPLQPFTRIFKLTSPLRIFTSTLYCDLDAAPQPPPPSLSLLLFTTTVHCDLQGDPSLWPRWMPPPHYPLFWWSFPVTLPGTSTQSLRFTACKNTIQKDCFVRIWRLPTPKPNISCLSQISLKSSENPHLWPHNQIPLKEIQPHPLPFPDHQFRSLAQNYGPCTMPMLWQETYSSLEKRVPGMPNGKSFRWTKRNQISQCLSLFKAGFPTAVKDSNWSNDNVVTKQQDVYEFHLQCRQDHAFLYYQLKPVFENCLWSEMYQQASTISWHEIYEGWVSVCNGSQ